MTFQQKYIYRLLRLKEETTEKKKICDRLPLISIAADILGGRPIIRQINNRIHHNLWHHLKVLKNWITLEERDCSQHEKEKNIKLFICSNFGSVGVVSYSGAGSPDDVTITTDEEADRDLVEWGQVTDT